MSMLKENVLKFNRLEREIYRFVCEAGCQMLARMLERWDSQLRAGRDKSLYRHKGKRRTTIKTLMGPVVYERTAYEVQDGGIGRKRVYLLDKLLEMETIGLVSSALAEEVVKAVCESPYRKAAAAVSDMTGQSISSMGAWRVIQAVGERFAKAEERAAKAAKQGKGKGMRESSVLFEEHDGVWLTLQGEDRKRYGRAREMKLAIAYDGAKKAGKNRYRLQNKTACANFEDAKAFYYRKEGAIADCYDIDRVEKRILNGDGASWIRAIAEYEGAYYQLDTFHRNKAVIRAVRYPQARKAIFKLLYSRKIPEVLDYIKTLANSVEDEDERTNLLKLHQYYTNNQKGLIGYHRRGLDLPAAPEGLEYRRLGAMESNVFSLVGSRMKRRRAAWSIRGGNNLARLLCQKATGKLGDRLCSVIGAALPPEYGEESEREITANYINLRAGKGFNGFHHFAATGQHTWLKDLMKMEPLSNITIQ